MSKEVVTRCPTKGTDVPIGARMDGSSFERFTVKAWSFRCPACDMMHRVERAELRLAGGPAEEDR